MRHCCGYSSQSLTSILLARLKRQSIHLCDRKQEHKKGEESQMLCALQGEHDNGGTCSESRC